MMAPEIKAGRGGGTRRADAARALLSRLSQDSSNVETGLSGSWATSPAVRRSMQGNRARDTSPELVIRRLLHGRGLRFRTHRRPLADLRCLADVVFPRERIAIFVDGCFWHGCPAHFRIPARNRDYWRSKIDRNRRRDARNEAALQEAGWMVLRFWEHDDADLCARRVEQAVRARRAAAGATVPTRYGR